MPTYEYKCEDCGYLFERFQIMQESPDKSRITAERDFHEETTERDENNHSI